MSVYRHTQGEEVIWLEEYGRAVVDQAGKTIRLVGVAQNITERKQAEESLRESDRRERERAEELAVLLDAVPTPVIIVHDPDSLHMTGNRATDELLRNPRGGETSLSASPETKPRHFKAMKDGRELRLDELPAQRAARGEHVRDLEFDLVFDDGSIRHVLGYGTPLMDAEGQPRGAVHVLVDITERKQAEETLLESEKQLAADLEAMTRLHKLGTLFLQEGSLEPILTEIVDAAIVISEADFGNIQLLDPESFRLRIVAHRGFPNWWIDFWNNVSEGRGVCGTALKRGERVIVEDVEQSPIFVGTDALEIQIKAGVRAVQSTPLVSRSGRFLGMFSTHYKTPRRPDDRALRLLDLLARLTADIIEQAQAEEALRQAKTAAEAANEAKGRFLANMSHELRTPMNAILGLIDVALPKAADPVIQDCLQTAKGSADLLLTILNDLLDSAKIESGKLELESVPFSLRRMLDQITRVLAVRTSEKGLAFYCRMPDETPDAVIGDRMRLQQVLLNLAGNAVKFTERGEVEVSLHTLSQDGEACLEFAVRDTGIGIHPSV